MIAEATQVVLSWLAVIGVCLSAGALAALGARLAWWWMRSREG